MVINELSRSSTSRHFTTDSVVATQSTEYWENVLSNVYVQLACNPDASRIAGMPFHCELQQHRLSTIDVSVAQASPQKLSRTPQLISRANDDAFIVSIQRRGQASVQQDGRIANLSSGDFAIYDSTRPYSLAWDEGIEQLTLKIPRIQLLSQIPRAESLTARRVCGHEGAGHLLLNMIETLVQDIDQLDPIAFDAVATSIVSILTAGLQTIDDQPRRSTSNLQRYHLERIRQYVAAHLHDPQLSVSSLASALKMSVSSVYRVFDAKDLTLADWIWQQRLERCRRELVDPELAQASITRIAFRWGFRDVSHFSRAFKRAYGMTPRDFRQQVQMTMR